MRRSKMPKSLVKTLAPERHKAVTPVRGAIVAAVSDGLNGALAVRLGEEKAGALPETIAVGDVRAVGTSPLPIVAAETIGRDVGRGRSVAGAASVGVVVDVDVGCRRGADREGGDQGNEAGELHFEFGRGSFLWELQMCKVCG